MHSTQINYIEFGATDIQALQEFYRSTFGWQFTDYGPEYTEFTDGNLTGGFTTQTKPSNLGALVVLQHDDLEKIYDLVQNNGGSIVEPIFSFPGGRRFHFSDPSGNVLAIWSK